MSATSSMYGQAEGNCHYCGFHLPFKLTEIDHKLPKSKGGTDHIENLVLACANCNRRKGSMDYLAFKAKMQGEAA